ncbi:hypothetical protein [Vibrio cholerae]|uniref:hypothetical protein n=1 Tax=Vibrio cholerae TaxID=666 RepID=UPI000893BEF1|nr:hypothetical protein [Vibrio cholerae]EGR2838355.1 hypothetical protein [Vibrio cholerae]EJL6980041.1 hypothetical protein [Vibrio cholerae]OFI71035.1 hypothetical protein BFX16_17825 [Vibrio cholerae]OFI73610.1 hypothetical protein BFX15_16815 [Vibrio cholerae]PAS04754.1 hypothetical protein CGT80_10560 [Vibrio cholerae]
MISIFIKRAFIISSTRFVALSLAMIDMIMLGHGNLSSVQDYTLASQISQVFVILSVMLSIGVNILLGKSQDSKRAVSQEIFGYSILVGVILLFISLFFGLFIDISSSAMKCYYILSASILPLAIYIGLSNILESIGLEKKVLGITTFSALINILFNYSAMSIIEDPAIAVSTSTLLVRILIIFPAFLILIRKDLLIPPKLNVNSVIHLFSFGRTEALTSIFFTGGISLLVLIFTKNHSPEETAFLGFSLNFMNTFSVIYVGLAISLTISLSNMDKLFKTFFSVILVSVGYVVLTASFLVLSSSIIANIYTQNVTEDLVDAIKFSVAVISIDGIALIFISWLRVQGFSQLPPLFRLSMVFIGIPSSFIFSIFENAVVNVIFFMALGNLIASLMVILYFICRVNNEMSIRMEAK